MRDLRSSSKHQRSKEEEKEVVTYLPYMGDTLILSDVMADPLTNYPLLQVIIGVTTVPPFMSFLMSEPWYCYVSVVLGKP